mmetsp:Transcript_26450/g.62962  ORF Transcript_26450/g.62962 Transcript_26450/m.62962 type:complete len:266 (-) Transcript_26450:111-908(-)
MATSTTSTSPPSPLRRSKTGRQIPKMYLAEEDWSPRFEPSTFYSFKMDSYVLLKEPPSSATTTTTTSSSTTTKIPPGKSTFPAYYYKIVVLCGRSSRTVLRRYSQFKWLYGQLPRNIVEGTSSSSSSSSTYSTSSNNNNNHDRFNDDDDDDDEEGPPVIPPLSFPPPTWTCCQPQNDKFAQSRLEELRQFLRDTLIRTSSSTNGGGGGDGGGHHHHHHHTTTTTTTTETDAHNGGLHSTVVSFLELDALADDIDMRRTATIQNLV